MLDLHLQETEGRSWLYVGIWVLLIFFTIPLARGMQTYISAHWGREFFLYAVVAAILALLFVALWKLIRTQRTVTVYNYGALFTVSGIFIAYTLQLRRNPEEAVHFVQYGVLGLLTYRALSHRIADNGIYLAAFLLATAVGICDEALQWLMPKRVWGLHDIWLNSFAAALVMLGLALGMRPGIIIGLPTAATGVMLCRSALIVVVLLAASLLNTPRTILWLTGILPGLEFVVVNSSVMAEYGYLYDDPETGVFRSRLGPEQLAQTDKQRASEAAARLDRLPEQTDYAEFLRLHTPFNDPFLHEARVHLNRRDYYLQSAANYRDSNNSEFHRRMTIAHYENKIMEKYFPETLARSVFLLPSDTVNYMQANALHQSDYESAVSEALLTRITKEQVMLAALLLTGSLLVLERVLAARRGS